MRDERDFSDGRTGPHADHVMTVSARERTSSGDPEQATAVVWTGDMDDIPEEWRGGGTKVIGSPAGNLLFSTLGPSLNVVHLPYDAVVVRNKDGYPNVVPTRAFMEHYRIEDCTKQGLQDVKRACERNMENLAWGTGNKERLETFRRLTTQDIPASPSPAISKALAELYNGLPYGADVDVAAGALCANVTLHDVEGPDGRPSGIKWGVVSLNEESDLALGKRSAAVILGRGIDALACDTMVRNGISFDPTSASVEETAETLGRSHMGGPVTEAELLAAVRHPGPCLAGKEEPVVGRNGERFYVTAFESPQEGRTRFYMVSDSFGRNVKVDPYQIRYEGYEKTLTDAERQALEDIWNAIDNDGSPAEMLMEALCPLDMQTFVSIMTGGSAAVVEAYLESQGVRGQEGDMGLEAIGKDLSDEQVRQYMQLDADFHKDVSEGIGEDPI